MPTFVVTAPDGKEYEVDAPKGATQEQALSYFQQNWKPAKQETIDPTEGMSGTEKFLAGTGKAFYDIGRGAGQALRGVLPEQLANRLDLPAQADIDAAKRRDEALMRTGAGIAGNITGNIAATAPAMFIPGVNTAVGGAAVGAGLGAIQPVATGESRLSNAVVGGVAGGVLPAAVGGYKAARAALYDPLVAQERIMGGALTRAIGEENAPSVAQALRNRGAQTPDVRLSAGTVSENEALTALEDAIKSQIPSSALGKQAQANRSVLAGALRDIGQDETSLLAAKQAREQTAESFYNAAKPSVITPTAELNEILKTPAMKEAWKRAERIAQNEGKKISFGANVPEQVVEKYNPLTMATEKVTIPAKQQQLSVEGLHYLKMGIDDMLGDVSSGIGKTEKRAIAGLKDRLLGQMEQLSPEYEAGRAAFASMSKPIGQMQVGQKLYQTLVPATSGENPAGLNYNALAKALRNPDVVAQQATGFKGARMANVMTPEQLASIQGVASDASRMGEAIRRGMGTGSPTARRMAQGNMISEHFAENAPVISKLIGMVGSIPGVNVATKGASAVGGLVGNKLNQNMIGKLDEMLANDPAGVARLVEQELKRLKPSERSQVIQMLPQTLMLSLPSQQ